LAVLHQIFPQFTIDVTTIALICIAIAPWVLRYIKGFEIPGIVKIDLADAKAATDKLTRFTESPGPTTPGLDSARPEQANAPTELKSTKNRDDSFAGLRAVNEIDPNLTMVGFRIEVEKRLRRLANARGLVADRLPLQRLITDLVRRRIVPAESASGLLELIALGNRAAHGVEVSEDAASWLMDIGPSILLQLDAISSDKKG
jgi:hypothetical protein